MEPTEHPAIDAAAWRHASATRAALVVDAADYFAAARLGLGGPTLPQAADCARQLIELAPFRETGYVILMEALERSGNVAEALRVYDELRVMLRDELAIAPSLAVQTVYRRLLGEATTKTV